MSAAGIEAPKVDRNSDVGRLPEVFENWERLCCLATSVSQGMRQQRFSWGSNLNHIPSAHDRLSTIFGEFRRALGESQEAPLPFSTEGDSPHTSATDFRNAIAELMAAVVQASTEAQAGFLPAACKKLTVCHNVLSALRTTLEDALSSFGDQIMSPNPTLLLFRRSDKLVAYDLERNCVWSQAIKGTPTSHPVGNSTLLVPGQIIEGVFVRKEGAEHSIPLGILKVRMMRQAHGGVMTMRLGNLDFVFTNGAFQATFATDGATQVSGKMTGNIASQDKDRKRHEDEDTQVPVTCHFSSPNADFTAENGVIFDRVHCSVTYLKDGTEHQIQAEARWPNQDQEQSISISEEQIIWSGD